MDISRRKEGQPLLSCDVGELLLMYLAEGKKDLHYFMEKKAKGEVNWM